MILKKIQEQLEALYQLKLEYNVEDFLIPQKEDKKDNIAIHNRRAKEALLIKQTGNEIELALYVEPSLLKKLEAMDPFLGLNDKNLEAFLMAVEGVSHFIYFLQGAAQDRPMTQLELEIQAEIDKYLLAAFLFYYQTKSVPVSLFSYLFENFQISGSLKKEEASRYEQANVFATKFCADLEKSYIRYSV